MPKPIYISVELTRSEGRLLDFLRKRTGVKARAALCRIAIMRMAESERATQRREARA